MTARVAISAVAGAAALAVWARPAIAGCHGGGGGGSGNGGGGGGGGIASSCHDDSDVVGFRHCEKFGAWSSDLRLPVFVLETGALVRQFPTLLDAQSGTVTHGVESFAYRVVQPAAGRSLDSAALATMRGSFVLPHGLYTGAELDVGGLLRTGGAGTEMMSAGSFGSPELRQDRGFLVDGLGVLGARGATGFGSLGVELAGGVRAVTYSFHSSYHNCDQSTGIRAMTEVAEARARGEVWLGPWLTAGVTVGASLLERNAWMGGLFLGVHSRAYNGAR